MKKLILMIMLLMCSMSVLAETSICNGIWENGQPVHVVINWSKDSVNINGALTKIAGVYSDGIITTTHTNKFGHVAFFVIFNSQYNVLNAYGRYLYSSANTTTFIIQKDVTADTSNTSRGLTCSKSFTKPFMARMI